MLVNTSLPEADISYDPKYIRHIALRPDQYLDIPLSVSNDQHCAILTPINPLRGKREEQTAIYPSGKICSIILNDVPQNYFLLIHGHHAFKTNNNRFDFDLDETDCIWGDRDQIQRFFGKYYVGKAIDFDKIDHVDLITDGRIPDKYSYTVVRSDGTEQTYTVYRRAHRDYFMGDYAALEFLVEDELVLLIDDDIILSIKNLQQRDIFSRIYLHGGVSPKELLPGGPAWRIGSKLTIPNTLYPGTVTCYSSSGTVYARALMYIHYAYPLMTNSVYCMEKLAAVSPGATKDYMICLP